MSLSPLFLTNESNSTVARNARRHMSLETELIPPRLVRWSLLLGSHQYTIEYRSDRDRVNVDGLSRLPRTVPEKHVQEPFLQDEVIVEEPLSAINIAKATIKDKVSSKVLRCTLHGWGPNNTSAELQPYRRQNEISVSQNWLIWMNVVMVPEILREFYEGVV